MPRSEQLLEAIASILPAMRRRAELLDREAVFPHEDFNELREAGLLAAPVPRRLGGLGAGTEPDGAPVIHDLLRSLGRGNLSVGRLFEAHVNALRLIVRYGDAGQTRRAMEDAVAGELFGLWVTDPPGERLASVDGRLAGRKGPCSGAGHCTRALVTVSTNAGTRLVGASLSGAEPVSGASDSLLGMRAAVNGTVDLTDVPLPAGAWIGEAGDYLREPDFSCGAWRTTAVTLGGLEALVEAARTQIVRRGHDGAPMQQARFGQLLIAEETARLWTQRVAQVAEQDGPMAGRVAYVNLARLAVERACLDAIELVQRSLGLAAFVRPNPVERISRDLSTYLRQPAPDAVLLEAAAHGLGGA